MCVAPLYLAMNFRAFLQQNKKRLSAGIKLTTSLAHDTGCEKPRGRQKVTERHKHHSAFCYSAEWSSGISIPHSGTMCSRIISSIKVHLPFILLYTGTAKGHNVLLFFYILLLLTYSIISCWRIRMDIFALLGILFMACFFF